MRKAALFKTCNCNCIISYFLGMNCMFYCTDLMNNLYSGLFCHWNKLGAKKSINRSSCNFNGLNFFFTRNFKKILQKLNREPD